MRVKEDKEYQFDNYIVKAYYNEVEGGYSCYLYDENELFKVVSTTYKTRPERIARQVLVAETWARDL